MSQSTDDATTNGDEGESTISLTVPEMDCPSCAGKVDKSLKPVEGVRETTLQATTGTARVTYDSETVTADDIVGAIEGAGYEVTGRDTDGEGSEPSMADPSQVWTSTRAIRTWVGAVFVTLGLAFEFVITAQNLDLVTLLDYTVTLADSLFLVAVLVTGSAVVREGLYSARNRSLDIDLLMGTAIVAATGIGYFVEAATLAVLFSIAELLEEYSMDRARDSLRELMELSPDEATVERDGEEVTVPADDVEIGETVLVRPGDKIPLDGTVLTGESAVDESPITGESVPVDKSEGDEVYAGTISEDGYLEVEVTSTSGDSTLSQIIEMVQGAQDNKTESEQFVDRFAGYYTPLVVVLAILTATLPTLLISQPITIDIAEYALVLPADWQSWFIRGLTLLVIACPCAFVISTPVSVVSGITSAARNGVLIKGGNYLETMGEVDAIAVDKTGTLTKGELTVTDVIPVGDTDERELLGYAASLEERSEHPIAEAILARTEEAGVTNRPEVTDFESLAGKGIRAEIDGETYYAGKPALFEEFGLDIQGGRTATDGGQLTAAAEEGTAATLADLESDGKTVVLVGTKSDLLGIIAVADEVRSQSRRAVQRLQELGVKVVMLTGDNEGTAKAIADHVGVDEYRAELLPEEKVQAVETLQSTHDTVAMVGDGINDAPALAAADIGIAMGAAGTDTALETADIALMGDDIGKLPYLSELSRTANGVIRQNIWGSLAVKALLAVGVPLGYVSVALAVVVGDMGMSLGVTGNAMRLARIAPDSETDSDADL